MPALTGSPRPLAVLWMALATALFAATAAAQTAPLGQIAGRLLSADESGLLPGDETLGHFELRAEGPNGDVRTDPVRLVLQTSAGRIEAQVTRRYSANIDPVTGRPRRLDTTGSCSSNVFGGTGGIPGPPTADPDCLHPSNALEEHSVNQTLFHLVCASSIGFSEIDRSVCGQTIFGSQNNALTGTPGDPAVAPTVGALISNTIAGNPVAGSIGDALAPGLSAVLVPLNTDPCDGLLSDCATPATGSGEIDQANAFFAAGGPGLNQVLTAQQKALLGCGEFYGTNCETQGLDLLNAEISVLMQAWPGIEGTGFDSPYTGPDREGLVVGSTNASGLYPLAPQPGTVGFVPFRGPIATRDAGLGVPIVLPGARGPNDPGSALDDDGLDAALESGDARWLYDPRVDGCTGASSAAAVATGTLDCAGSTPLLHPFTGQRFSSELAAAGWNAMMLTVAFSFADDDDNADGDPATGIEYDVDEFDPNRPFRTDGCSFENPNPCSALNAFWAITGIQRDGVNAGGNGRFGRRDFVWAGGVESVIDVATGDLAPLLGEAIQIVGPESSRLPGAAVGMGFTVRNILESGAVVGLDAYGVAAACGNGVDDDGDGLVDTDDPGCASPLAEPENPSCDDGLDNDDDGLFDFDDPQCRPEFPYTEGWGCGLGAELALLLLPWAWWRRLH